MVTTKIVWGQLVTNVENEREILAHFLQGRLALSSISRVVRLFRFLWVFDLFIFWLFLYFFLVFFHQFLFLRSKRGSHESSKPVKSHSVSPAPQLIELNDCQLCKQIAVAYGPTIQGIKQLEDPSDRPSQRRLFNRPKICLSKVQVQPRNRIQYFVSSIRISESVSRSI